MKKIAIYLLLYLLIPLLFASCEKQQMRVGGPLDELFPDEALRKAVAEAFDKNGDGELSTGEANVAFFFNCSGRGVESMEGIDQLINLVNLDCSNNKIKLLNIGSHRSINKVVCKNNSELSIIKLGENIKLEMLDCSNCSITEIRTDGRTTLNVKWLNCQHNRLQRLDCVKLMPQLQSLNCNDNLLTELNVYKQTNLGRLLAARNRLTKLRPHIKDGGTLYCSGNPLGRIGANNLDLSAASMLSELRCDSCGLTEINPEWMTAMTAFMCSANKLTEVNLSGFENLTLLDVSRNELSVLDLSGCQNLVRLFISYNKFDPSYELQLAELPRLQSLNCLDCGLSQLDLGALSQGFIELVFNKIPMKSLDVSMFKHLDRLVCRDCGIEDIKLNEILGSLDCRGNHIESLDISHCHDLRTVDVRDCAKLGVVKYCRLMDEVSRFTILHDNNTRTEAVECDEI